MKGNKSEMDEGKPTITAAVEYSAFVEPPRRGVHVDGKWTDRRQRGHHSAGVVFRERDEAIDASLWRIEAAETVAGTIGLPRILFIIKLLIIIYVTIIEKLKLRRAEFLGCLPKRKGTTTLPRFRLLF